MPRYASAFFSTELGGSFKSVIASQQLRQRGVFPKDSLLLSEQRLRMFSSISNHWFRLEAADETSFILRERNSPLVPVAIDPFPRNAWETRREIAKNENVEWTNRIDRLFVQLSGGDVELTVGKQVVATGVGHFFSAVSQVPRQPFIIVDPEFPVTEDAVAAVWNGPFTLEARFLPKVSGQARDNYHLRAKSSRYGHDLAMTAGFADGKSYVGMEAAGNLGDSLLRGEIVGYDFRGKSYGQALLGIDTVFSAKWSAEAEVFYNGFGGVSHRSTPYRGHWYTGVKLVFEPDPRWKITAWTIANLQDPSVLVHLSLSYSLSPDLDCAVGQFFSGGNPSAEFGGRLPGPAGTFLGLPDMTYLLLKFHF